ncbi:phosphate-selective porin OprO and OprP [Bradyrhizobium sp. NFR13]|jgi:phosphate-selective porin OprO/OprP|uniref:porin n=1 Tax=Bradyrhizobium sp. NFR13 TaxID=1566285 RepID=UPI0008E10667|nr:porin [Bradyrhizobium sp. NFR13]SFL65931.1 phosphate-selective porin OprO and OprP [Bradyrhizobium sp. NFR13]
MSFTTHKILGTLGVIGALTAGPAHAQSSNDEIAALKAQLRALEKKLDNVQKQANTTQKQTESVKQNFANANAAMHKKAVPFIDATLTMPGNRPTFCTTDGLNCIAITGRLHLDTAAYSFSPKSAGTSPQSVNDGINARRARLGLIGTFNKDWEYGVIVDAGGTTDGDVTLNNAYVAYKGVKGLLIQGGYIDVPYTLDEATSSNNIMFMERAASQVLATNLAAGDNRAAFGGQVFGDHYWVGAYVTGPTTGLNVNHSQPQPLGATFRAVGLPMNNEVGTVLVGFDALYLAQTGGVTNNTLGMSDRIEVRVDPATNALLNTGTMNFVNNARVLSGEAAVKFGSFMASGEYFDYNIQRSNGLSDLSFNGGYGQASYVITGEQHKYSTSAGAFGGINPARPVNFATGDLGAWELAVRYSYASLNDGVIRGGELKNTTVGVNWYVNQNMRFMFNWIHGTVDKFAVNSNVNTGADYDVFAMRTQVAF